MEVRLQSTGEQSHVPAQLRRAWWPVREGEPRSRRESQRLAQRHGRDLGSLADVVFHSGRAIREDCKLVAARVGQHPDRVLGSRVDARPGRLRLPVRGRRGHPAQYLAGLDGGRHGHRQEVLQERPDAGSESLWRQLVRGRQQGRTGPHRPWTDGDLRRRRRGIGQGRLPGPHAGPYRSAKFQRPRHAGRLPSRPGALLWAAQVTDHARRGALEPGHRHLFRL